jgi:hypothetical protein
MSATFALADNNVALAAYCFDVLAAYLADPPQPHAAGCPPSVPRLDACVFVSLAPPTGASPAAKA